MITKTVVSKRFELTHEDVLKWIQNQTEFLKPLFIFIALLYLGFVIPRVQDDGISLEDFRPTNAVLTSIALYGLNALYDLLRKYTGVQKYVIEKKLP